MRGIDPQDPALHSLAEAIGSDVPACLLGRTAIGKGRGEQLTPVPGAPGTPVLLVNPGIAVSTAQVFAAWDGQDRGGLMEGDVMAAALAGRNDLYSPARSVAPAIDEPLDWLRSAPGATLVRMSGSGATCFALFETGDEAEAAAERLRDRAGWWVCATRLRP